MTHETLTVITRLTPATAHVVRTNLASLQEDVHAERARFLHEMPGLFFARWVILPRELMARDSDGPEAVSDYLAFGADFASEKYDGPDKLQSFLRRLIKELAADEQSGRLFDAVYRNCPGYPSEGLGHPEAVEAFLLKDSQLVPYAARHVEFPYRFETPEGIAAALELRRQVDNLLNDEKGLFVRQLHPPSDAPGEESQGFISKAIHRLRERRAYVERAFGMLRQHEGLWGLLTPEDVEKRRVAARRNSLWKSVVYPPIRSSVRLGIGLCQGLQRLVTRAQTEPPPKGCDPRFSERPVQNPLVLVSEVAGGALGLAITRMALGSLDIRLQRYLVGLNDIKSIHCARWLLYKPEGEREKQRHYLVFFSNYDGSWESYIDAFVEHRDVREFLQLIWSQADGFPTPRKGRPFVRPFKAWIHSRTAPVLVWYSAFNDKHGTPNVSTVDIQGALRLRELLSRPSIHRPLRDYAARRALWEFLAKGTCEPERLPLYVATEPFRLLSDVLHDLRALFLTKWRQFHGLARTFPSPPTGPRQAPAAAPLPEAA